MGTRAHVVFPDDLAAEIDELAGKRGRNAFIVENMRAVVRRERLLRVLRDPEPIWRDKDHPELAAMGTVAWLKKQRAHKGEGRKNLEKEWWNRK